MTDLCPLIDRLSTSRDRADHAWVAGSLVAAFVVATLREPLWSCAWSPTPSRG
jgi:hypothetical protein